MVLLGAALRRSGRGTTGLRSACCPRNATLKSCPRYMTLEQERGVYPYPGSTERSPDFRRAQVAPQLLYHYVHTYPRAGTTTLSRHDAYRCLCDGVYLKSCSGGVCGCERRAWQRRPKVDRRNGDNQRPAPRSPTATCRGDNADAALVWRLRRWRRDGGRGGGRDDRPSSSPDAAPLEAGRGGAQGSDIVGRTWRCACDRHLAWLFARGWVL